MDATDLLRTPPLAPLFAAYGLVAVDVGSRGGFDADLLPAAWAVDVVGFEPEPDAFAVLWAADAGPWRSVRLLPNAVAGSDATRSLHVPRDAQGASLLRHDTAIGRRFGVEDLFEVVEEAAVDTRSLDSLFAEHALAPHYLKLDVEGAELEVLEGATRTLGSVVAVKAEAGFLQFRHGQPLACDLVGFLDGRGFELMDILDVHRWRRGSSVPAPYLQRCDPAFSKGQAVQADLLFMRRIVDAEGAAALAAERVESLVRTGLVAALFGYFDHARAALAAPAAARAFGRTWCRGALRRRLRDCVPLLRSLFGGLPG